ncbi:5-methyltetrahydropteroyltriglutamate--homocysteine S-methyltransferase [Myroides sp. LJL115]
MKTHNLGYPRIGSQRELKKACELYWSGQTNLNQLLVTGENICKSNWKLQQEAGLDLIPCNDFSFYDQVLDMSLTLGAIPERYKEIASNKNISTLELYFAMARGYQKDHIDITAMEMTKWFDTNYHYIVPEFTKDQSFKLSWNKIFEEFDNAKKSGINAKCVIIGLVTYLLLGKEKQQDFDKLDLVDNLLPIYIEILSKLQDQGAKYIQFDEPFLALDICDKTKQAYEKVYNKLKELFPDLKFIIATYFEGLEDNLDLATSLPIDVLHLDLVRAAEQLNQVIDKAGEKLILSLGVVDGRNIWKTDLEKSLNIIQEAKNKLGKERIWIAPSCSLLHSPCDLDLENTLAPEIKNWLSFAKQKTNEIILLKELATDNKEEKILLALQENKKALQSRKTSTLIHNKAVKQRVEAITAKDSQRENVFAIRKLIQQKVLNLPLFPTTTIGSFPQTAQVRTWRAKYKKGELSKQQYDELLKEETKRTIDWQQQIGIDVLVHGEFERNDMVEYFGERLEGFAFTKNGWVQSYGSRCVKPPIIYGDISRENPMTVYWSQYAQSISEKWVKGMLTGPITILQWSFVRDDQPRLQTCQQIALAIRDEVIDLEKAGIKIIQIDEPAIAEGLPLRKSQWDTYLKWAVECFRISASGVKDEIQIHTHMCYSEFNDIIEHIAAMDADVITIECSRSQMDLLDAFYKFKYPNEIGPGIYDIHSPRIPTKEEMIKLLEKAQRVIPAQQLWVNPDCGLKTRHWEETQKALVEMIKAAKAIRQTVEV